MRDFVPACYFCDPRNESVVTYVRWQRTRNYAFLCADHRAEHQQRFAREYPISHGIRKVEGIKA